MIRKVEHGKTITGLIAAIAIALLLLGGCTPTRYVPVESVRTEYVGENSAELLNVINSLNERLAVKERQTDSLMHSRNERLVLSDRGDTLRHDTELTIYRASHREKELERLVESQRDSIRELTEQLESVKSDTIRVPYPVEKQLSRWEQTKMDFGGFALGGVAVVLCIAVVWLIRKIRR